MAVSWFDNWSPPPIFPDPFHAPLSNHSHNHQRNVDKYGPISNLLPFFLQLGLLDVPNNYEPIEHTGPFVTWYQWKMLDFQYETEEDRQFALSNEDFIPENNLPLGVEVYKDRLFITMPKWKAGVPATLAVLPKKPKELTPRLVPYPNWDYHNTGKNKSRNVRWFSSNFNRRQ